MLVIEPATAFRTPSVRFARDCRLLFNSRTSLIPCNKITRRNNFANNRIRASAEELSGPVKQAKPQRYHPSEDISDSEESDENGDAILGPAETSRTVIEVNSKAMLMFSGVVGDGVHENIFWPDLPYATDEHGKMSLLGFVKRKGKGYKVTSRALEATEDFVLDRTAAVTYSVPEKEKDDVFKKPIDQATSSRGNLDAFLSSSENLQKEDDVIVPEPDEHVSVEDNHSSATPSPPRGLSEGVVLGVEATGGHESPVRKEHHRKRKDPEDLVGETPEGKRQKSASVDDESKASEYSYDITETYVPRWQVRNGDTLTDPAVCYQILHHAIPPGELDRARDKKEDYPAEGASVSIVRALSSVSELVQSYFKKVAIEKKLRGRITEYRAEITKLDAKLAKRKKGDRSSVKKGKEAIRALGEMKMKHTEELESLQAKLSAKEKEVEELEEKNRLLDEQNVLLTKSSSSLQERIDKAAEEKEAWRQCKVNYDEALAAGDKVIDQLKIFLDDAEKDRDRLVTEVIPSVVSKLHKSKEFLEPLGEMETLLYNSAFHDGIVAGFDGCSAGLKIDGIEGYDAKANTVYETGVKAWESTTYPFIEGMKKWKGKTSADVEKLTPSGSLSKDAP